MLFKPGVLRSVDQCSELKKGRKKKKDGTVFWFIGHFLYGCSYMVIFYMGVVSEGF